MTETLKLRYDRAAPRWGQKIRRLGYHGAYDDLVAYLPRPLPGGVVAHIGCGTGALAERARTALGRHPQVFTQCTHLDDIKRDRFETILCAHVVEHCPTLGPALSRLHSALRPSGTIALAVSKPHWCTWALRQIWGHRAYSPEAVVSGLAAAGFSDIRAVAFRQGPPSRTSHGYIARKGPSPC